MGWFDTAQTFFDPMDFSGTRAGKREQAAIDAQTQAAAASDATQKYMYDTTRSDQEPWRTTGVGALSQLSNPDFQKTFTSADFQADPGYQFRMQEGQKAIERSAAARGGLQSGATLKSLTNYAQNAASQEYQGAYDRFNNNSTLKFNRLAAMAGLGQTANQTNAAAGQNYANQVSANQIGVGNAYAAQQIAANNRQTQLQGQAIGGGAAILAASDERLKTNIEPISKEDLSELKSSIKAYKWNYKDKNFGEGDWIGVMAQDLEKSKLGRTLVIEDERGNKLLDLRKVLTLFLATLAEA